MDILAIDDFAFKKLDQFSAELLYAIIDSRYRQKSIIITSNRAITDCLVIFPDPVVANAILDWFAHSSHQIIIESESFRIKFRPKGEKNE